MRKGFYFSMDAVMALLIMSGSMMLVLQLSDSSSGDFESDSRQFQEASTTSRDVMRLASVEKLNSLNESYTDQFRPTIDDSEMDKSVLNAISLLWANRNTTKAKNLTERYFRSKLPEDYEFKLIFDEDSGESIIFRTKEMEGSPRVVTSVSSLVSGHKINKSSNSYSSRALLSSVTKNQTETVFFGGYVGQGSIFYNVTLEGLERVNSIDLEGDFSGPFDLYINDEYAGNYTPTEGNLTADIYSVCGQTENRSRCNSLTEGDNIIRFNFTGEDQSLRGGLMEINYRQDYQLDPQSGDYREKVKRLPGIDGIINYYSSFYVPGDINGITADLHYDVDNRTVFAQAGNTTIYENRTIGDQDIRINNSTISNKLEEAGIDYSSISRNTVPFRIGLRNIESEVSVEAIADAVSVVDVSGSMGCGFFEFPPCKIDEAQEASKTFSDIILNESNNRAGFVSYNEDVVDSQELTSSDAEMETVIDSQSTGGTTCIGCGILESIDILEEEYINDVFSRNSEWEYTEAYLNSTPPEIDDNDWTSEDYDTSSWNNGSTLIGNTGRAATELNNANGSIYLRKEFYIDLPAYKNVSLDILSDSAATVYLNGEVIDNDTSRHSGEYWNRQINADGGLIRRGDNVLAVKLKNSDEQSIRHWIKGTATEWNQGTFTKTQERNEGLELETTGYTGTKEDVNADNYCNASGDTTGQFSTIIGDIEYSTYMERVQINGMETNLGDEGDNGGDLDGTDSISDVMVPGESYQLNTSFYTGSSFLGDNTDYATVAFDWDQDGNIDDNDVQEVGACSATECTVSTSITVPEDADTGSTLMRVMGEEGSYHKEACQDPDLNEVEDYSVYVGRPSYENGSYLSQEFDAGISANWSSFDAVNSTPEGTGFETEFSPDGNTWFDSIEDVPNSDTLRYNISLLTEDPLETPRIEEADVAYGINNTTTEFDASLELLQQRVKSMIVMSDGNTGTKTSMLDSNVEDYNNDGQKDAYDHTVEAACRASEQLDATIYTVGFGDGANEQLLNQTANECGDGKYYYSDTSELEQVFRNISNSILNASFAQQTIETDDETAQGRLYSGSKLTFNYSNDEEVEFGNISVQLRSDRFGGNVTSPKQGSFYVPEEGAELESAKVTSYSGSRWTDKALINQSNGFETFYNLSNYGQRYDTLGDPFLVNIPRNMLSPGNNTVRLDTIAVDPETDEIIRGGSPDNRFYYTVNVPSSVGYGSLFNTSEKAREDAIQRLREELTLYGDEPIVDLNSSEIEPTESVLTDQPRIWGPANVRLVVWE